MSHDRFTTPDIDAEAPRIRPGDTVANPVTGESFTFIHTAADTDGELLAFDLVLKPGGAVPMSHVHPIQTETFRVIAGEMHFRLGRRTVTAGPGELVEIEPGVRHSFANRGEEPVRVRVEARPALLMEEMFADVIALAEAGRLTPRGMPRSILDLAVLARTYDQVAHAPFLGVGTQRLLLAPLVALARLRGRPESPAQGSDALGSEIRTPVGTARSSATSGAAV